jgi:heptosyltransferase-1
MNVLIIKTSSLGDVVHTLPALSDAKKAIPDINFDWVAEEAFAEIPEWHTAVKDVFPVAWRRLRKNLIKAFLSGELLTFLKTLRQKKYDLIIDAQGLIKSAVIAKIARGRCCGYDRKSAREQPAAFFYAEKFTITKDEHAITRTRQLFAAALKYEIPTTAPNYGINKQIFPRAFAKEKYMVFFHGTSREEKCWHEQKWIELVQFVTTNGFIVYLPWGNNTELARAKRIVQNNNHAKVLPKLNLSAIAALLINAKGAVAVDTGLGHVAAALGVPTISLYGPTNPKLSGTVGIDQIHMINFEQITAADVWQTIKKEIAYDCIA